MRAAMYYRNDNIKVEEVATPRIKDHEILVKIYASGICGSDVMEWYRIHKAPLILGHEIAGEVVQVGDKVTKFKKGDRVAATHHVPCHQCHHCLTGHETVCELLLSGTHFDPGGFCEYVRLEQVNVEHGTWKIPETMSYDAATFIEPLACVIRGQRIGRLKTGASVLVLGSGISGLLHIHLASISGAGFIAATDISDYRLKKAREFGASSTYSAKDDIVTRFKKDNQGRGADLVIICASAEAAFKQGFEAVERGGTILVFAPTMDGVTLPLSVNDVFWRRDVTITTTYAGSPADCVAALKLISHNRVRVEEMITHRFGLADTVEGSKLVAAGGDSLKVIIHPQR
nr:alcohol dehydrogenase catalytic domain-containing protein [Desulfobulbaceae bacterium]